MEKKNSKIGIILVLALALILSSLGILKLNTPLAKEFDVGFATNRLTAQAVTPVWGGNGYTAFAATSITIDKNPNPAVVYDGLEHAFVVKSTPADLTGFTVQYKKNVTGGAFSATLPKGAGSYDIKITRPADATYLAVDTTITNGVVINKAPLLVFAPMIYTNYGWDSDPKNYIGYDKFVEGEDKAVLGGTLVFDCAYTPTSDVNLVGYPITLSGLTSENYEITYKNGYVVVKPAYVAIPTAESGLVYSGKEILGVSPAEKSFTYSGQTVATNVGTYSATATLVSSNYQWMDSSATPKTITWKIDPKPLMISVEKEIDGTTAFNLTLTKANCPDLVKNESATIKFDTSKAIKGTYKGNEGIPGAVTLTGVSGTNMDNYSFDKANLTAKIVKSLPDIKAMTATTYNGTKQAPPPVEFVKPILTTDYSLSWAFKAVGDVGFINLGAGVAPEFKNAGIYQVTATGLGEYDGSTKSSDYVVNQIVAELEWTGPTNMVFDGAEKKLTATVKNLASQGTVKDVCVVTVKLTDSKSNINAGKFTFTAESLDNKNYKLSTEPTKFISQEFEIARNGVKKPTKGTAQTYSGKTIVGINDVVANVNAKVGYTIVGDYHAVNVKTSGDYSAVFTLDLNHCWGTDAATDVAPVTIAWNILPLTADLKWTKPDNLVYDKTAKTPTVTVANLKTQGTIKDVCDVTIEATTANSNVNVGAFTFTAKVLGNTNYKLPAIVASESYSITAKPLANIMAEKEFVTGNVDFSLKLKSTNCDGLIGTDDVTITFKTSSAEKGTYAGNVSGKIAGLNKSGADSGNYSIEVKDIIAKIVGKSLPEITAMTSTNYNKNVNKPTVKVGALIKDTHYSLSWKYSVGGKPFVAVTGEPKFIDAGTYRVTATGVVGGEYDNSTRVADYVINPITITLTWGQPANLVYDKTAKIPSVVAGGLLGGDACEVTIGLTAKKDNVNAGKFTFTATGVKNTNYTLPSVVVSDEYTITKAVGGNAWTATPNISIVDITEGGTLSPKAPSKYGTAVYTYYAFENGFKGNAIAEPSAAGKYYVTAKVEGTASFDSIAETDAKQFSINPKSSGGGSSGGGSSGGGSSSSEDVFWIVVINAIKTNSEAVIKKECNYGTMPKKVLEALKDTDKTLEITMNGEKLTITSAKAKTLTLEKSSYTIEELKAMLADKPVITPTPTVKPTEPTAPEEAANMTWAWVVSALFILSLIIAVYIVREKKNKQKPN